MAFYVRTAKEGGTSIIKFGSYDPKGLKDPKSFNTY